MILDSSAVIAMVENEPERELFFAIASQAPCRMSVGNWLEACLVVDNRSPRHPRRLDDLLEVLEVDLVEVTPAMARVARDAHRRFGRGSGSSARLNYGDCFAYALAISSGEPLLFMGDDFGHTDVTPAAG